MKEFAMMALAMIAFAIRICSYGDSPLESIGIIHSYECSIWSKLQVT